MRFSGAKIVPCPPYMPLGTIESLKGLRPSRALREFFDSLASPTQWAGDVLFFQNPFDKLVDGEASSPARCRASNLRFEPSAVSPRAKPENPKGFQPPYHPHQFLLKSKRFPGAKTARKRFLLWKMRFSGAKIDPCPPYTPLGAIESSRGLRPSRALRGFFDSLNHPSNGWFAQGLKAH